jgi:hypothetical protein
MFSKLLQMMKNMLEKAFKAIKPILDFVKSVMKALGKNALTFLRFLGALGTTGVLSVLLPATAALGLLFLIQNEKDKILANPDAKEYLNNPFAQRVRGEAKTEKEAAAQNAAQARRQVPRSEVETQLKTDIDDADLIEQYGANRADLNKWLNKTEGQTGVIKWQKPVLDSEGNIRIKAGDTRDDLRMPPPASQTPRQRGSFPGGSDAPSSYLRTPESIGNYPGGSKPTAVRNVDVNPSQPPVMDGSNKGAFLPMASPVASPVSEVNNQNSTPPNVSSVSAMPSPVTRQMAMAQRQNFDLNLADASEPETRVIDNSKIINGGGSDGVDIIKSASVRTDNRTLRGIQKQNARFGLVAMA